MNIAHRQVLYKLNYLFLLKCLSFKMNEFTDQYKLNSSFETVTCNSCKLSGHLNIKSHFCTLNPDGPFFIGPKLPTRCNHCNEFGHKMIRSVHCLKNPQNPNYNRDITNSTPKQIVTPENTTKIIQLTDPSTNTTAPVLEKLQSRKKTYDHEKYLSKKASTTNALATKAVKTVL